MLATQVGAETGVPDGLAISEWGVAGSKDPVPGSEKVKILKRSLRVTSATRTRPSDSPPSSTVLSA